jgi:glutathione S-transferase
MSELILHHFDASPFAEKVRVCLGLKQLPWQSVQIPMIMPKPDLTALTGGYRKTPVLQIGADIYCDTQRIATELEARFPEPTLFPQGKEALCHMVASWADTQLFQPGAGLSMGTNPDLPEDILSDRFAFFDFLDQETLPRELPHFFAQFSANLQRIEQLLSDGRPWLLGESPSWADAACYASVWMCRGNIQGADSLLYPLPRLQSWEQRVLELGHGKPGELEASQAIDIANNSTSTVHPLVVDNADSGFDVGQKVTVTPEDYGAVPVAGLLERATMSDIAIRREDERAGDVVVHFPRAGYRLEANE